ncbi:uncharacterized protein LOC128134299 [Lactuca sativa]|uniref:uncharacterized protein LOC128134299 n=1 Tax=Lactuca sativa TaxID=4236 RepID=UPI0022AFFBDC|nr:uncharacterized protein LOC128134299 [Lactuca sativa]
MLQTQQPATRGKKPEKGKGKKVVKGAKGPTPKKRKSSKADQSPPPKKKKKTQPKRKLILASSSIESEDESSDSVETVRGDSPPPTKTTTTGVGTNVSDTGDRTSAPEDTPITEPTSIPEPTLTSKPPPSPLSPNHSAETETFLGGEDMTFDSVYYSSYQVQSDDDDDDAPVTKKHIKEHHEKIDNLVASSSSSWSHITEAAIQGMVETFTKAHEASINSAIVAIDASKRLVLLRPKKSKNYFEMLPTFWSICRGQPNLMHRRSIRLFRS